MAFEIICGITAVILMIYYYFMSTFDFWKSRGIRGPRPIPLFGNVIDLMLARRSLSDFTFKLYNEFKKQRMVGIFSRQKPILCLNDLDLIKDVLIKDFSVFSDRVGFDIPGESKLLSQHLISFKVQKWRSLRKRLSPVFTFAKLKEMFSLISKCSEHLEQYLEKLLDIDECVEINELTAKYTTDVIVSCAFGIETNAFLDEGSELRRIGRQVFNPSWYNVIRQGLKGTLPWLYDVLEDILPQSEVTKFFLRTIIENMQERDRNNIIRQDFVDILRDIKKHPQELEIEMSDSFFASQAFIFFAAGFESSSTTMNHVLYELALNPKIQNKLREEIYNEYAKNSSVLTYENVKEMNYLDKVFKETLRKYPPGPILLRDSICNYTFVNTNISIPKGQRIWIPVFAIQRDPEFYPEPDVFDPDRFNEDVVTTRHSMSYLPFGHGPRNCIGARFATYQSKVGLITILRNHKVEICNRTQIPYMSKPKALLLTSKDGIYLRIVKVKQL